MFFKWYCVFQFTLPFLFRIAGGNFQKILIYLQINIFENIEDHSNVRLLCIQNGCHRPDCCFSCFFISEMEFSGRYTAKGNAPAAVCHGQLQTGAIAGGKRIAVLLSDGTIDDWSDCMQDIFARQIKRRRNLRFSSRLFVSLRPHYVIAQKPQLDTASRVNNVINTVMKRMKTPQ